MRKVIEHTVTIISASVILVLSIAWFVYNQAFEAVISLVGALTTLLSALFLRFHHKKMKSGKSRVNSNNFYFNNCSGNFNINIQGDIFSTYEILEKQTGSLAGFVVEKAGKISVQKEEDSTQQLVKGKSRHRYTADELFEQACVAYEKGQMNESIRLLERACKLYDQDIINKAKTTYYIGMAYLQIEQLEKAEQYVRSSIQMQENYMLSDEKYPLYDYVDAISVLAVICNLKGNYKESLGLYREGLRLLRDAVSDREENIWFSQLVYMINSIVPVLLKCDERDEAAILLREGYDIAVKLAEEEPEKYEVRLADSALLYGKFLFSEGKLEEAEKLLVKSLVIYRERFEPDYFSLWAYYADALIALVFVYNDQAKGMEVKSLLIESLDVIPLLYKKQPCNYRSKLCTIYFLLGKAYFKTEGDKKAISFFHKCLSVIKEADPDQIDDLRQSEVKSLFYLGVMFFKKEPDKTWDFMNQVFCLEYQEGQKKNYLDQDMSVQMLDYLIACCEDYGESHKQKMYLIEALPLYKELGEENPRAYLRGLCKVLELLALHAIREDNKKEYGIYIYDAGKLQEKFIAEGWSYSPVLKIELHEHKK